MINYIHIFYKIFPFPFFWSFFFSRRFTNLQYLAYFYIDFPHFYATEIEDREAYWFCPVCHSLILIFCPPFWNFNPAYNFLAVSARTFIVHINIPCDKTFPWIPLFFTLDLGVWPIFEHFYLHITFKQWVLELWYFTWIFRVIRPFRWYHYFLLWDLDLGVGPIFLKTLTLCITF